MADMKITHSKFNPLYSKDPDYSEYFHMQDEPSKVPSQNEWLRKVKRNGIVGGLVLFGAWTLVQCGADAWKDYSSQTKIDSVIAHPKLHGFENGFEHRYHHVDKYPSLDGSVSEITLIPEAKYDTSRLPGGIYTLKGQFKFNIDRDGDGHYEAVRASGSVTGLKSIEETVKN